MATDPVFAQLLNTDLSTFKKKAALPAGTAYPGTIKGYALDRSKEKKTAYVRFTFNVTGISEDVDPAELEAKGITDLSKYHPTKDFFLTEDAGWRIKAFFESLGHQVEGKGTGELLPLTVGASVLLDLTTRNSQDGKEEYTDVREVIGAP